jgi:hypothetical protein
MTAASKGQQPAGGSFAVVAVPPANQADMQGQQPQQMWSEQRPQQQTGDAEGITANSKAEPANAPAATAAVADAEVPGQAPQQQQLEEEEIFEQQLGGRLLSVRDLWLNMPLTVALQVGQ